MAGYVCKIVIENTHPPVWRRVMIPDRITFGELHQIIQVLFAWDDIHFHEFKIPSEYIRIDNDRESAFIDRHFNEDKTLIDPFFDAYKWIRYTYNLRDVWNHRINIEKYDNNYTKRCATLLKFKGDHFTEDSSGIWETCDVCRIPFEQKNIEEKLSDMSFSEHSDLQRAEIKSMEKSIDDLKAMLQTILNIKPEILNSVAADVVQEVTGKDSPMKKKIREWLDFSEVDIENGKLLRTTTTKTQKELMTDLGKKEAADYYKYLRLPQTRLMEKEEQISGISEELRKHPEYLLYVFDEEEYTGMLELLKLPEGASCPVSGDGVTVVKAIGLGLTDFSRKGKNCEICLASDIKEYIGIVDEQTRKKTYKILKKFDVRMGKLLQVYGMVELESLYNIYQNIYKDKTEEEDFFRLVYWHARFNDFLETVYRVDGNCYVVAKDIDAAKVLEKTEMYADKLPYREYSAKEIDFLAEDLSNRSEYMDYFFVTLQDLCGMQNSEALACLESTVDAIVEGDTLDFVLEDIEKTKQQNHSVESAAELWKDVAGIMLDMELPMLKGRCRGQYAAEQKVSPWSVGMLTDVSDFENTKKRHIYQFPAEIQEQLYGVDGNEEVQIRQLLAYKEQNKICSEEFIYLLAEKCLLNGLTKQAEPLIHELMVSSTEGKSAAKFLKKMTDELKKSDDSETAPEEMPWNWTDYENAQKPYIRATPKIGRNDPCPCGSGKKYKKCCGR